jgi:hypothetical protein
MNIKIEAQDEQGEGVSSYLNDQVITCFSKCNPQDYLSLSLINDVLIKYRVAFLRKLHIVIWDGALWF